LNARRQEQNAGRLTRLGELDLQVLYTSPGEPARSTAAAIASELGIPVKEIEELRNLDHGLWQGLLVEDVRRKYPKVFKQWQESPETNCPPQADRAGCARKNPQSWPEALEEAEEVLRNCRVGTAGHAHQLRDPQRPPELPNPICGMVKSPLVEVLIASAGGNGSVETPTNGASRHSNGKQAVEAGVQAPAKGGEGV
jgi:hypothetical protein